MVAYAQSDYANEELARRCYADFMITNNGNLVSWNATKQRTIALSTAEAETYAISRCMNEALCISRTVPDIYNAVHCLTMHSTDCDFLHFPLLKRIIRYLKETFSLGLVYKNTLNPRLWPIHILTKPHAK